MRPIMTLTLNIIPVSMFHSPFSDSLLPTSTVLLIWRLRPSFWYNNFHYFVYPNAYVESSCGQILIPVIWFVNPPVKLIRITSDYLLADPTSEVNLFDSYSETLGYAIHVTHLHGREHLLYIGNAFSFIWDWQNIIINHN